MNSLHAITTEHGLETLSGELKETVTQYQLIGALTPDADSEALYRFHSDEIEASYFDENGVLSFVLNLPIDMHFDEYLHHIYIMDADGQNVITCETPKIALAKGVGGMVTLKADITGEAGDVVFKHGEFITESELFEVHLPPLLGEKEDKNNAATDDDIDSVSEESKLIKLPQFWRALSNWFKAHKEEENPHEQYFSEDNLNISDSITGESSDTYASEAAVKAVNDKFTSQFVKYFGTNGYQKLPSGLIIQWGTATTLANGYITQTLPIAFPTTCFHVSANHQGSGGCNVIITSRSKTQIGFRLTDIAAYTGSSGWWALWIAIGY